MMMRLIRCWRNCFRRIIGDEANANSWRRTGAELLRLVNPRDFSGEHDILTAGKPKAVKPNTAYLILRDKYELDVSYETFKLYVREIGLTAQIKRAPTRLELPPGAETQIDYGSAGSPLDQRTGKHRRVHAYAARLSCSRLPNIQFVWTQNSESFVESNICMVEFYDGVTERLPIDNLKRRVLKPHIWDPKINRAYAEFAEHYGTFIDTARVGKATDKDHASDCTPLRSCVASFG